MTNKKVKTKLFTQNKKIKNSSAGENHLVINFGIPAFKSESGLKTCPMAGECATGCYAQQGAYIWSNVKPAFEFRLTQTQLPVAQFIVAFSKELESWRKRASKQEKQLVVRIHDSGDFYSLEYFLKWSQLMSSFPNVKFYAYTKMVPLFKRLKSLGKIPANFRIIYSFGGLADRTIDIDSEFHSQVFSSLEELQAAGYSDCTKDDLVAGIGENHRIGLVYHGAKSRHWSTHHGAKSKSWSTTNQKGEIK